MKLKMFTVKDLKAELHSYPYPAVNAGVALRMFEEWVLTPDHPYNKYPEDYSLWETGYFDQVTGLPERLPEKIHLAEALQVRAATQNHDEIEPVNLGAVS